MTTKKCKTCLETLDIDHFEVTTKDGKSRRGVCKPCYRTAKANKAKEASKEHDPSSVPYPVACCECGKGPDEVTYKWRTDTQSGGWRPQCNSCFNNKGYSIAYRNRERTNDEGTFLARNAATHLAWANLNRDKVHAQQLLSRTLADRKFKVLVQYVKQKYGSENVDDIIAFEDAEILQFKMSEPCFYCEYTPREGDALNGLDRVIPGEKYDDANTVSCCGTCNAMKMMFTIDEFITGIRDIINHAKPEISTSVRLASFGNDSARRIAPLKIKTDTLTLDQKITLWSNACYLCNRAPAFGIDRLDASKPYEITNCKSCCTQCNYMKKDYELMPFLGHVARIYNHTLLWVLGDSSNTMSLINGTRQPVAIIDKDNKTLIIFPSLNTMKQIIGHSANAVNVSVVEYKQQSISIDHCKEIIYQLRFKI
jgi:hypothetical protein